MPESSDSHMEAVATVVGDIGDLLSERHALEKSNNRLEFTFSATNETFRIKHSIYVITCAGCSHNYIGEARDVLRNRVIVHKQQIRDLHVYLHPGGGGGGVLG